jgi:hypothetical protein
VDVRAEDTAKLRQYRELISFLQIMERRAADRVDAANLRKVDKAWREKARDALDQFYTETARPQFSPED